MRANPLSESPAKLVPIRAHYTRLNPVVYRIVEDPKFTYAEANKYIVGKCDKLIALWDGKKIPLEDYERKPINRGGTYDCIKMAETYNKEVIVVKCYR